MEDSLLTSAVFGLLVGEFCNSRGCRVAESWVALLDLSSLPHKALQLRLGPSHVVHEMAIVCRDSSPGRWRYCACNTVALSDCRDFFRGRLTSRSLFMGNVTSETHHIIYQNDPRESRNCSIFRKISVRTSCKKLWTVTEKMWESLFFCYKTGRDIIPLKLVPKYQTTQHFARKKKGWDTVLSSYVAT